MLGRLGLQSAWTSKRVFVFGIGRLRKRLVFFELKQAVADDKAKGLCEEFLLYYLYISTKSTLDFQWPLYIQLHGRLTMSAKKGWAHVPTDAIPWNIICIVLENRLDNQK